MSTVRILCNLLLIYSVVQNGLAQSTKLRQTFEVFKHQPGHCEPLRLELWASLIMRMWQASPDRRAVRYELYTRQNEYKGQMLAPNNFEALRRSNFNASWPVRIVIHGWSSHSMTCACAALKDVYLERDNFNIILVDWSDYAMNINYAHVVVELVEVAQKLSEFTAFLNRYANAEYHQMYLIGHSAGSHIAGLAGKRVPPPAKYGVIYALDPAGPIHLLLHHSWRLMPDDAHYVEAIHTDIALFGYDEVNIAHASFFVNWGLGQPHCPNVTSNEPDVLCDHFSAVYYFVESVRNPYAFGAVLCEDFEKLTMWDCQCPEKQVKCYANVFMGGEPATSKRGVYYFSTRKQSPFGYGPIVRMKRVLPSTIMKL